MLWGGGKNSSKSGIYKAADNTIDLTESYVFRFDAGLELGVTYNTATQANLVAPKYTNGDKNVYYIAASEAPTRINIGPKTGYGISSVTSVATGKNLDSYPDAMFFYVANLAKGDMYDVTIKPMDEVRCGTLTITIDDPTDIRLQRKTSFGTRTYLTDAFADNKLVVKYDPNSETAWTLSNDKSEKIYKTTVNGEIANRADGSIYVSSSQLQIQVYTPLHVSGNTTNVDVVTKFPDTQIPLKIAINPTEGSNDTYQPALNEKITKVSVNGKEVPRSEWDTDNFTVKNGSSVYLTYESQLRGVFELGTGRLNGNAQSNRNSYFIESYDDAPAQQNIIVDALVMNRWRYNIKCDGNYDKVGFYLFGSPEQVTSNDFDGTAHYYYTDAYVRPLPNSGYKIASVKVNGQTVAESSKDRYDFPLSQDMKIEVATTAYARDQKANIYSDANGYGVDVTLDPLGTMYKRVEIKPGLNEVSVNAADFPVEIHSAAPYVYVNGVRQEADEDGLYLAGCTVNDNIKILNQPAYNVTITYEDVDGTIYHDGKVVAANNSYEVLQGTQVKVVPRSSASNLVLQTGSTSFATKQADKSFVFYAQNNATVSLHPENPKVTINIDNSDKNIYQQVRVTEGTNQLQLTSNSTQVMLPYYSDRSTYSLRFSDLSGNYEVSEINCLPSSGTSFDAETATISGVKDGMTVTVVLSQPDKPYKVDLTLIGGESYKPTISFNSSTGQWDRTYNSTQNVMMALKTGDCYDYENNMETPGALLQYGPNNSKNRSETYKMFAYSYDDVYGYGISLLNMTNNYAIIRYNDKYEQISAGNFNSPETVTLLDAYEYNTHSIIGKIFLNMSDQYASPLNFDGDVTDFYWSVDGSDWKMYDPNSSYFDYPSYVSSWSSVNDQAIRLFHGSEIKLKPVDGEKFKSVKVLSRYKGELDVMPDADGVYTIMISEDEMDLDPGSTITIEIEGFTMTINAQTDEAGSTGVVRFADEGMWDFLSTSPSERVKPGSDSFQFTCDKGYTITGVTDLGTGKNLMFDRDTYTAYGFYDGINICIHAEELIRDKSLKVYYVKSASASVAPVITLSEGKAYEVVKQLYMITSSKLDPVTEINFADFDLPMSYSNGTYSGTRDLFINDKKLSYDSSTKTYAMPMSIESGSEMYIINVPTSGATSAAVTYEIDEDIPVIVKHGNRTVTSESTNFATVPVGTVITVEKNGDTKYEYTTEYVVGSNAAKTLAASGYAVTSKDNTLTVRVAKTYHTITVNGTEGTDLSMLKIVADDVEYPVAEGNNVINIPTHVTSMTIVNIEDGKYIDAIEGLEFDNKTGVATGLSTGTITVDVKEVERPMEVTVYVDSEELSGGALVLGNGKIIESNASVEEGYNTINFSEEDLPIIYRVSEFDTESGETPDPSTLPTVYVNGEKLEYSPEHGGYVFPVEALTGSEPPVIKIYPPVPEGVEEVAPVKLTYLVEPGITFKATEDHVTEVAEAGMRDVLPGTDIIVEASADNGDDIYVELDGNRIEAVDGKYNFALGNSDMTVSVKFEKLSVTINADEWNHIRINGGGLEYPMYDASSTLEFPQKTSEFYVFTTVDGARVTGVTDGEGNHLPFDLKTGRLTGVTAGMTLNVLMGEYDRNIALVVYLEETEEEAEEAQPISHIVLAAGTTVEKALPLVKGYQIITVANEDLPLAVTTVDGVEAVVFLNNEALDKEDGEFKFPAELAENSIVKIFTAKDIEIAKAEVHYDFATVTNFDIEIHHDHMAAAVDGSKTHMLLPGTEINFTVTRKAPKAVIKKAVTADDEDPFTVTANDEVLEPQEDGSYMVKINDDHVANGLNIKVQQNEEEEDPETTAIEDVVVSGQNVDVYNLNGILLKKAANANELKTIPAGVYIVNGKKVKVNN